MDVHIAIETLWRSDVLEGVPALCNGVGSLAFGPKQPRYRRFVYRRPVLSEQHRPNSDIIDGSPKLLRRRVVLVAFPDLMTG